MSAPQATIPNRPVFRAQEVCEIADVQPFVLRTWEAEFPDLGVAKSGGPRVYRRADVERVLRIKHLLFAEGLTLAGARRRLAEEGLAPVPEEGESVDAEVAALIDGETRQQLRDVRRGLQWILGVLSGHGGAAGMEPVPARREPRAARPSSAKPMKVKVVRAAARPTPTKSGPARSARSGRKIPAGKKR